MTLDTREVRPNVDEEMCYDFGRKHRVHPLHGHGLVQDFSKKLEAGDKVCWIKGGIFVGSEDEYRLGAYTPVGP